MPATSNLPILPLKVAKDIEPEKTWENMHSPDDLLNYMAIRLGVDISQLDTINEIIYSSIEPVGSDRRKLWLKTEGVPAIGIPFDNQYKMIWQYPPNVPLLWVIQGVLPAGMRRLTVSELTRYGLTNPPDINYYYVINEVI